MKNLFLIFIVWALTSFNYIKLIKSSGLVDEDRFSLYSKFPNSDSGKIAYFTCEDFVSNALNNYSITTINRQFLSSLICFKESVVNLHDSAVIDTIYTFSNTKNEIQIYRAKQDDFIFTFDVTDSIFKLTGNIKPGMTKEAFARKFHTTRAISNRVQIFNAEGSMAFTFYFKNNTLRRINSWLYLD